MEAGTDLGDWKGLLEENENILSYILEGYNDEKYIVNPSEFLSMGKSTPFEGAEVYGKCKMTLCNGKVVWEDK